MRKTLIESPLGVTLEKQTPKRCYKCKQTKIRESDFHKAKNRHDGHSPHCKECRSKSNKRRYDDVTADPVRREARKSKQRVSQRNRLRTNADARASMSAYQKSPAGRLVKKRSKIKSKYGLNWDSFTTLFESQDGKCAGCASPLHMTKEACVDHDHRTGRVRGILCHPCNRALGAVRDNTEVLRALIQYLEVSREENVDRKPSEGR